MEDDIDIYADLPNINLQTDQTSEKNQACTCEELKKELNSLTTKLEDVQKRNKNLEKNLSSLLKTAKAEITRKDKMINELRMRLDNATFRRNKNRSMDSSTQRLSHQQDVMMENYESIIPFTDSKETEIKSQAPELHHDEYTNQKQQNDLDRIPITVFGERLHKKIMEYEKKEKKQEALSKLDTKINTKENSEECIMESDKENGSRSNVNNNNDKSNTFIWNLSTETSCMKNSGKRTHDESDIRLKIDNKRLKIEDPGSKVEVEEIDYNSIAQYSTKNNTTWHDVKNDFATSDDRLSVTQSLKEEQKISSNITCGTSEHENMKQDRSYTNKWKEEERASSEKNYGNYRTRRGSIDGSKSSRTVSTASNIILEEYNNSYHHDRYIRNDKKSEYRNNSSNYRSYSRKNSDYEWSKNYYLREKPSEMHRDRKYNDYKYNNYYKAHRSKRSYDNKEDSSKLRCSSNERAYRRDKSKHSFSDVEDRESRNYSRNNRKYESSRIKSNMNNILDERLYKNDKTAETGLPTSSSPLIMNSVTNYNTHKNVKQHNTENESGIKTSNLAEITSIITRNEELYHLEEGEILDNPTTGNKSDFIPFDRNKELTLLHENSINTTQFKKVVDVDAQKVQIVSLSPRSSLTTIDHRNEIVTTIDDSHNDNHIHNPNKTLNDFTANHVTIEWPCASDSDDEKYQICDQEMENSVPENITKFQKIDDSNIKNNVCKFDNENLRNTIKGTTKIEGSFNHTKNIDNDSDKNQLSTTNETSYQKENNIEKDCQSYLTNHDYIQNISIDSNITSTLKETLVNSESCEIVPETGIIKDTNSEEMTSSSSLGAKKTSVIVKNQNDKQNKGIVISRRRKAVTLSDNNASMTMLMNTDTEEISSINSDYSDNDSVLKPRLAKLRASVKTTCK